MHHLTASAGSRKYVRAPRQTAHPFSPPAPSTLGSQQRTMTEPVAQVGPAVGQPSTASARTTSMTIARNRPRSMHAAGPGWRNVALSPSSIPSRSFPVSHYALAHSFVRIHTHAPALRWRLTRQLQRRNAGGGETTDKTLLPDSSPSRLEPARIRISHRCAQYCFVRQSDRTVAVRGLPSQLRSPRSSARLSTPRSRVGRSMRPRGVLLRAFSS
ncbi:hypothetical protein BV20DRAFT_663022 [Pilatotrama ljubarskyi]|nr:hypothetical protein BV20DRAFT_663022 [Pilatotrama ljubarskyi]